VLAANIAADLAAWCQLLGLYDCDGLKDAEPDTLRYRLSRPARPARPARPQAHPQDQRHLAMEGRVHHLLAAAMRPARTQLTSTNHPGERKGACPARSEPVPTRAHQAMPSPAAITRTAQTGRNPAPHNR